MTKAQRSRQPPAFGPIDAPASCRPYLTPIIGVALIWLVALAVWRPVVIGILVNFLVTGWRLTGNLGTSIVILSLLINGAVLLLRVPELRAEQEWRQTRSADGDPHDARSDAAFRSARGWSGMLLSGIRFGLPFVVVIALLWIFWRVLPPPESQALEDKERFLWNSSSGAAVATGTGIAGWDLRQPDRVEQPWSPVPLPGMLVLTTAAIQGVYQWSRDRARRQHGDALLSRRARAWTLIIGTALGVVVGVLVPSGVVLYWLAGTPLAFLELWLFPLAASQ